MNIGLTAAQIKHLLPYFVKEVSRSNRDELPVCDLRGEAEKSILSYSGQVRCELFGRQSEYLILTANNSTEFLLLLQDVVRL